MRAKSGDPLDICPSCHKDLTAQEIPVESRIHYGAKTHFSNRIGIVENDRVVAWKCPECGFKWRRDWRP